MSDKWQPIETAPKDGTQILVWSPYRHTCVTWYSGQYDDQPHGWIDWFTGKEYGGNWYAHKATHWMPLPDPPKERGAK